MRADRFGVAEPRNGTERRSGHPELYGRGRATFSRRDGGTVLLTTRIYWWENSLRPRFGNQYSLNTGRADVVLTDLRGKLQSTLGSAYTLDRELGGGGMSRVFTAIDTRLQRPVVVKVLSTELAAGVSVDRFEREIRIAASLQQANIVPLLSAGETDGIPYYMMPFVEGESLRARLGTGAAVPIADCIGILRDVARALSYAHARGVVHRDIKPDNVLLSHGAAVVTDFGIAKALAASRTGTANDGSQSALTATGTSIGTPAYMAPEQIAGGADADHRADLYALGCVAYELLTGRPPFAEASAQKMLAAHLTQRPRPVRELRSDTPTALAAVVMQCLEKNAADRPATADDVLHSLESVVTPSGGHASMTIRSVGRSRRGQIYAAVALLALALLVVGVYSVSRVRGSTGAQSIAVMPLANLSGDASNDYFGEGLAEEITGALAKAGLHVIGRGSARALTARGLDAREVAKQLAVSTVLQGNVQRAGDRVRISVSLISGSDGSVRWTQTYDRQFADVFAVQDEIARSVATQLRATLSGGASATFVRNETSDPQAHALYLQGLYLWNRRTGPAIRQAIGLFQQAVARDPRYGRAYAGIALATIVLPYYEDANTDSLAERGRAAAERALAIDSTLTEAWTAKGFANTYQWNNADAERDFLHAIAVDSSFATTRFWYGLLLMHTGRFDEARRELDRAQQLEPTSLVIQNGSANLELNQRRPAEAESILRGTLVLDSTFSLSRYYLGVVLINSGRANAAIAVLEPQTHMAGVRPSLVEAELSYAYFCAGRPNDARRVIRELRRRGGGTLPPLAVLASTLMALGDRDTALAVLQTAVDQHDPWLVNIGRTAQNDQLRADPRGKALLERTEAR